MRDVQIYKRGQIYWKRGNSREDIPGLISKVRPVILVSNDVSLGYTGIATVVPLTTCKRYRDICTQVPLTLNNRDNYALCEQVYTCKLNELGDYIATCNSHTMDKIDTALCYALGLKALPDKAYSPPALAEVEAAADLVELPETSLADSDVEETTQSSSRQRWTDSQKQELCSDYDEYKQGNVTEEALLEKYRFSNISSLYSSVRKFKRQMEVS